MATLKGKPEEVPYEDIEGAKRCLVSMALTNHIVMVDNVNYVGAYHVTLKYCGITHHEVPMHNSPAERASWLLERIKDRERAYYPLSTQPSEGREGDT